MVATEIVLRARSIVTASSEGSSTRALATDLARQWAGSNSSCSCSPGARLISLFRLSEKITASGTKGYEIRFGKVATEAFQILLLGADFSKKNGPDVQNAISGSSIVGRKEMNRNNKSFCVSCNDGLGRGRVRKTI